MKEYKAIEFLMEYGFKMMRNVKGEKKVVYIELPSENIDEEIKKIMTGADAEIDYWYSGKDTALVSGDILIYIKEVF